MSSPAFNENYLNKIKEKALSNGDYAAQGTMTLKGSINKTIILFITMLVPAVAIWWKLGGDPEAAPSMFSYFFPCLIGTLILSLVISFVPKLSPYLAPVYAALEGVLIGIISMIYEAAFSGIVIQAVGLTLLIVAAMLICYRTGLLRATPKFTKILLFATMGVGLFYLSAIVMRMFGNYSLISFYMDNSLLSIGLSVLIAGIAAFNLILDFDLMDNGSKMGLPKYMEWYAGFGVLVTVVWLYLEILRLLSKLSRD